jgi:hypothetical protein
MARTATGIIYQKDGIKLTEFNYKGVLVVIGMALCMICLLALIMSAGCVTASKEAYREMTATPVPTPTPTPTPTPAPYVWTPEPTPAAIEPLTEEYIDPFAPGPRSEGQWYKWFRPEVQGLKSMQIGIIAYRHRFLDRYTWYNAATGNYFTQRPTAGNRYFAVWIHEEMIGETIQEDPSFWAFDDRAFALQVKDQLITSETNRTYLPVNRIREFDDYTDYYDVVTAPPFGYYIRYSGTSPGTAGMIAEKLSVLRMGKGNAHDGFILYEVPKETQLRDIALLGEFGTFGQAQWTFPEKGIR